MTLLQIIFIISGVVLVIISVDFFTKKKLNLFNILLLLWAGILLPLFVIFPGLLDKLGGFFWIVSWVDLLIYSSIIFLFYVCITLTNKLWDIKTQMTSIVRELAIENSERKKIKWKIVFIIPVYNEAKKIKKILEKTLSEGYKNIIVINDGSSDTSLSKLRKIEQEYKNIVILNHFKNRWQWAALETGFEYIRRYGSVDYIVTYDSDWQHQISDLDRFIVAMESDKNLDIAIGSRFLKWGKTNASLIRTIVLKLGIFFTYTTTGKHFTDTHNGYRVIRSKTLDTLRITMDRMSHGSEILGIIAKKKLRYQEIPVHIKYTKYSIENGQSSANAIAIAIRIIWDKLFR